MTQQQTAHFVMHLGKPPASKRMKFSTRTKAWHRLLKDYTLEQIRAAVLAVQVELDEVEF